MVSFEQKPLLLVAFSLYFIHLTTGQLVPGIYVPPNTSAPPRQEINTFIKDSICLNLLLLGLSCMQTTNINKPLSFYQLAGIHATSNQWNGDDGGQFGYDNGYCHHGDVLFLTWHRPYLSLFEVTMFDSAKNIVNTFPSGTVKNQYLAALPRCRLPYWDWVKNSTLPSIINTDQNVVVMTMKNGVLRNVTMPNPLYSYPTDRNDPNTMVAGNSTTGPYTDETVRNPTTLKRVYVSQPDRTTNKMTRARRGLKDAVYNAFSNSPDYPSFSNMVDGDYSIESPHGKVHLTVGGKNGHMSQVEYAGFDPLFFLHHCNVDRLFALWQAIYRDSYLTNDTNAPIHADTPLNPFKRTATEYWTSTSARNTADFGYTYPELINCGQPCVTAAVNHLYGPGSPKKKRGVATDSPTYYEYATRIKCSTTAAYGSYSVHFFLGDPSTSEDDYATDPNYVGTFDVFAHRKTRKSHKKMVKGTVSMTAALSELVDAGKLKDMTPASVKDYVKANFSWIITGERDGDYDLDGLDIFVCAAKVKPPKDEYSFPVWGKFSTVYQVV